MPEPFLAGIPDFVRELMTETDDDEEAKDGRPDARFVMMEYHPKTLQVWL